MTQLAAALPDAARLGYTVATLSGGEPFLYRPMEPLLAAARWAGLRTAVVTNGMFLDARRLSALGRCLDLIVVSLDGAPARHNEMRANPEAFQVMRRKLAALRESGIPFGFLFTLTRANAHEIGWAADFARAEGARLLEVHPLDEVGRAQEHEAVRDAAPDWNVGMLAARLAAAAQRQHGGALRIVVDFQSKARASLRPRGVARGDDADFASRVGTLCIETDGAIVPMGHGFARRFQIGRLGDGTLWQQAVAWDASDAARDYAGLIEGTHAQAMTDEAPPLVNLAKAYRNASLGGARPSAADACVASA